MLYQPNLEHRDNPLDSIVFTFIFGHEPEWISEHFCNGSLCGMNYDGIYVEIDKKPMIDNQIKELKAQLAALQADYERKITPLKESLEAFMVEQYVNAYPLPALKIGDYIEITQEFRDFVGADRSVSSKTEWRGWEVGVTCITLAFWTDPDRPDWLSVVITNIDQRDSTNVPYELALDMRKAYQAPSTET
jgi:hypothetical protein